MLFHMECPSLDLLAGAFACLVLELRSFCSIDWTLCRMICAGRRDTSDAINLVILKRRLAVKHFSTELLRFRMWHLSQAQIHLHNEATLRKAEQSGKERYQQGICLCNHCDAGSPVQLASSKYSLNVSCYTRILS